jgi:hypothetical protein
MRDFYNFMESETPLLLDHWQAAKARIKRDS